MEKLDYIFIGEFKEAFGEKYPPFESMIQELGKTDKAKVLRYLRKGQHVAAAPGILRDVFTMEAIRVPMEMLTDGKFIWRSDIAYYVDRYNLKLPDEFLKKVLST